MAGEIFLLLLSPYSLNPHKHSISSFFLRIGNEKKQRKDGREEDAGQLLPSFFLLSNHSQSLVNTGVRGLLCRRNAGTKQRGRGDGRQQCYLLLFSFFSFSFSSGSARIEGVWEGSRWCFLYFFEIIQGGVGEEVEDKLKSAVGKNKFCNDKTL